MTICGDDGATRNLSALLTRMSGDDASSSPVGEARKKVEVRHVVRTEGFRSSTRPREARRTDHAAG
jgi:hypothetical protein